MKNKILIFLAVIAGLTSLTVCEMTTRILSRPTVTFVTTNEFHFGSSNKDANITKITKNTYAVPPAISSCVLVCKANYPITWKFHNAHFIGHASWSLQLQTLRTARNIFDINTYEYSAIVHMYGHYNRLTGNYTCAHAARPTLRSSVYLFWQDSTNQKLIQANETVTVYVDDDSRAILPCISSDPDFKSLVLQKLGDDNSTTPIGYNNSVRFERKRGIILDNVPYITGIYRCLVTENNINKEFMSIEVKFRNATMPSGWHQPVKSNASITYDVARSQLKCCSSSRRSPIVMHYYCNHPAMCEFKRDFIAPPVYYSWMRKKSRRGCTTVKLYVHSGGLIHCIGDGIDAYKQYIFGIWNWALPQTKQKTSVYFDWAEIDPHDMISIQMYSNPASVAWRRGHGAILTTADKIFQGQILTFSCYASEYYYASGTQWAIKWKNNTIQLRDMPAINTNQMYRYQYGFNNMQITAHLDMEAIICIAPVWNSTEYIHKPYPVNVSMSSKPIINETLEETYTWIMNDTNREINCSAVGIPIPEITWSKLDEWWHPSHINVNHSQNVDESKNFTWEKVTFERVSYTTNGTYVCTVTNFGGMVQRKIHIFVQQPASWKKTVAIIVGIVLSLALLSGVLIMLWRLRAEKQVIRQLSSAITFKDGNIRPEPPSPFENPEPPVLNNTDYSNSTLDPNRLSANLID